MKCKFTFSVEPASDPKSNVRNVKRMQVLSENATYEFPPDLQAVSHHSDLGRLPAVARLLPQMTRRGMTRNLLVSLEDDVLSQYFDDQENPCFCGIYLEEIPPVTKPPPTPSPTPQSFSIVNEPRPVPARTLAKDFVLEKFTGKSQNAASWIAQFESECARLEMKINQYPETLRLFLDGSAVSDWFQINLKLIGLNTAWADWKEKFIEDFSEKGWSSIMHAYTYTYSKGPLVDFALKKLRLLIDADPALPSSCRINLIVISLPERVRNRIDRMEVETQSDLIAILQSLEHLATTFTRFSKPNSRTPPSLSDTPSKPEKPEKFEKFCNGCYKRSRPYSNHSDSDCRYNPANKTKANDKDKPIKVANNIQLENALNEVVPDIKN